MPGTRSAHHLSLFQYFFGTSRAEQILNAAVYGLLLVLLVNFVILPLTRLLLDALDYRRLQNRQLTFLELTPPSYTTKTPLATTQLFVTLHSLLAGSITDRWFHRKHILPLEIVTSRTEGIRFIAALNPRDVELFKQLLVSYLPSIRFKEVADYLTTSALHEKDFRLLEFTQVGHFAYSLADHAKLQQHDPISYLTGAMARPQADELFAMQIVLSPASARAATKVQAQLLYGQDKGLNRKLWHYPFILVWKLFKLAFSVFGFILEVIGDEVSGVRNARPKSYGYTPPQISPINAPVIDAAHEKLSQQLFNVDIRTLIISPQAQARAQGIANAIHLFHVPGYQGLVSRRARLFKTRRLQHRFNSYLSRLPSRFTMNSNVLAASEVAGLYHFPYGEHAQTEDMVRTGSPSLPTPLAMKRNSDDGTYDVMLGMNHHHGNKTVVGLTAKEREKHVYVIGGTGNGKTTLLEYGLVQDIINGKGVAFIDPHGDAVQKLLKYIPKSRIKDVIYLNPADIKHPIGINLLELPGGLDEDELLLEKERVTEAVVSVLRKVFDDDDASAHRIEGILRNAIHTAFTVPDATLFTVLKLLRNSEFRKKVVSQLKDEYLIDFWKEEFGQAGNMQRVSMSKGLTHRIDRFRSSVPASRMLGQVKSTISFEDIIDSGKILICNFSTDMGEDTSTLFGTTVLAKLKIAAERRSKQPEAERKPFYIYVDEFQNFATTPFVQMLSSSRKYKLFLTIAEQSTAQQEQQRLTEAILANVSTVVCFGLGSPADERLLLPRFTPYLQKGDLSNLNSYNFYMRVKGEQAMDPVSAETLRLDPDQASEERAEMVVAASRENYSKEYLQQEEKTSANSKPGQSSNKKSQQKGLGLKPALKHQ